MFKWKLDRPLVVFDIEATGITPRADRIVEIAVIKLLPDGTRDTYCRRVNPGMPIPPESTEIHGIRDSDVADSPTFREIAPKVYALLEGCDLAGYNVVRYDIPMLTEEFLRANIRFDISGRRIIDAQRIYHRREPRDLTAALAYFCGEMHLHAHGAEPDAEATMRVLEAQFEKYPDLPRDMDELNDYCNPRRPNWVDRIGRLKWAEGEIVLNFGRKKGVPLRKFVENDPAYIKWILNSDFPRDMQEIVRNAMEGKWPEPPRRPPESGDV